MDHREKSRIKSPAPQPNERCFACGSANPSGLQIRFLRDGNRRIVARWQTSAVWESFRGVIHGGILATVLDEAMSKVVAESDRPALTCELVVRFRRRVDPGEPLIVKAWVVERRKRRIRTEATLSDSDGVERAHGWATFLHAIET
jgi:acyl-coenzyme A thioesterase PaaI-like protein